MESRTSGLRPRHSDLGPRTSELSSGLGPRRSGLGAMESQTSGLGASDRCGDVAMWRGENVQKGDVLLWDVYPYLYIYIWLWTINPPQPKVRKVVRPWRCQDWLGILW